jgi:starch synthase
VSDQTCADGTASGFVFDAFEPATLEAAVRQAIDAHGNTKLWQDLIRSVMQQDWSWDVSARKYQEVYSRALANASVDVVDVR